MENTDKKPDCKLDFLLNTDQLIFIQQLINTKFSEENFSYNTRAAILEGLELLKIKYPNVPKSTFSGKRQYRGGKQRRKELYYEASINSTLENKNWVEDFIMMKLKDDFYYSKVSFFGELVEELKLKYDGKLELPPNQTQNENKRL